jgi:hypothetical protein
MGPSAGPRGILHQGGQAADRGIDGAQGGLFGQRQLGARERSASGATESSPWVQRKSRRYSHKRTESLESRVRGQRARTVRRGEVGKGPFPKGHLASFLPDNTAPGRDAAERGGERHVLLGARQSSPWVQGKVRRGCKGSSTWSILHELSTLHCTQLNHYVDFHHWPQREVCGHSTEDYSQRTSSIACFLYETPEGVRC